MLSLIPVSLKDANAFVTAHHRHHKPVTGHKFSIGCECDGRLAGVAIAGRPVSRYLDNGLTLEVTRLCSTGEKNACSMLRRPGRQKLWDTVKLSLTRWIRRTESVSGQRDGHVPDPLAANAGREPAAPLLTSIRRR